MDVSEWGASDLSPSPGSGLLVASSGLLPGGHRDAAPVLAPRGGIYWPEEPQIRHEAAVGDLSIKPASPGLFVLASPPTLNLSCGRAWRGQIYPVAVSCLWVRWKESGLIPHSLFCHHRKRSSLNLWSAQCFSQPGFKRMPWLFLLLFCVFVFATTKERSSMEYFAYFCRHEQIGYCVDSTPKMPEEGVLHHICHFLLCLKYQQCVCSAGEPLSV